MWASNTMTTLESFVTFLVGFSIVFICLLSLALFIVVSSKVINTIIKDTDKPKVAASSTTNAAAPAPVAKENNNEVEELAVIISAVSEEMGLPVDKFEVVSVKQI